MTKTITALLAALLFFGAGTGVKANTVSAQQNDGYQLIVNKSNTVAKLTRTFVSDAYLKKVSRWPNGKAIQPVDMPTRSPVRKQFSNSIMQKPPAAVRNYWTQLVFGGRDVPPPEVKSDEAVIAWVAKRPGAIGYISIYADTDKVRAVTVAGK